MEIEDDAVCGVLGVGQQLRRDAAQDGLGNLNLLWYADKAVLAHFGGTFRRVVLGLIRGIAPLALFAEMKNHAVHEAHGQPSEIK